MKRSLFLFGLIAQCCFGQYAYNPEKLIENLRVLSADSLEGRKVGSQGSLKARQFITSQLQQMGATPFVEGYIQPFQIIRPFGQAIQGNGANILAVIEGNQPETFVISAHYDHVGIINDMVYNGADDNASGTAALLAIAQHFVDNPPEHRLIITFFDAEEIGLKGSSHFVDVVDLAAEQIVLNINMDMLSRSDKNELYACGTFHYPQLAKPLAEVLPPDRIRLLLGHDDPQTGPDDWTHQSDQGSFHRKGIPFLYFGVENHADYHKPTDDFEKINLDFYTGSVETVIRAIRLLDKSL